MWPFSTFNIFSLANYSDHNTCSPCASFGSSCLVQNIESPHKTEPALVQLLFLLPASCDCTLSCSDLSLQTVYSGKRNVCIMPTHPISILMKLQFAFRIQTTEKKIRKIGVWSSVPQTRRWTKTSVFRNLCIHTCSFVAWRYCVERILYFVLFKKH